jgi:hypothetical protein
MAAIDSVLRALIEKELGQPVLALARFAIARTNSGSDMRAVVNVFRVGDWLNRRAHAAWPTPAYLAVCKSTVNVFSARFDRGTRLLGPVMVWHREVLTALAIGDDEPRVRVRPALNRPTIDLEAVEPGPESALVVRYLCQGPEPTRDTEGA